MALERRNMSTDEKGLLCLTLIETEKGTWTVCPESVYVRGSNGKMFRAEAICQRLGLTLAEEGRKLLIKKNDYCYNTYTAGKNEYIFTRNNNSTKREALLPAFFGRNYEPIIAPNSLRTLCNYFEFSGGRIRNSAYAKLGYGTVYVFSAYRVIKNCPPIGSVFIESGEPLEEREKKDNSFKLWVENDDRVIQRFESEYGFAIPHRDGWQEEPEEVEEQVDEPLQTEEAPEPENALDEEIQDAFEVEENTEGTYEASDEVQTEAITLENAENSEEKEPEKVQEVIPEEPKVPEKPKYIQPEYFTLFGGRRIRRAPEFRIPDKNIYWPDDKDMAYIEKEGMIGFVENGCGVLLINSTIIFNLSGNYRTPCIKFSVEQDTYRIELHAGLKYTFSERRLGKKDYSAIKQGILKLMLYKVSSEPDTLYNAIEDAENDKEKKLLAEEEFIGDCVIRCERKEKCNVYILSARKEEAAEEENKNETV